MCGIGGFVDFVRDARRGGAVLRAMERRLRPRGPDAHGAYLDADAALVHRRLAVIDPEGGAQPMLSPDGDTVLVYNGELYNTEEVRRTLLALGHTFRGHSDTEVVLHAFLEWDTDAFPRLEGIFAFALWQKSRRRLVLVRDRLGVKPLFYRKTRGGLVFGSTIDTVLCHPEAEPVLDEDGLRTLLLLGPARPPESGIFRGILSLLPGCFAVLTPETFTKAAYWKLEAHEHEDDLETTLSRTHELITGAAERQLVSDVPLACFLSGGLDSSILSMIAARRYAGEGKTLHTWSVDYRGNDRYFVKNSFQPTDDRDFVTLMAETLGTRHHRVVLEPEAVCAALLPAAEARGLPGMADVRAFGRMRRRDIRRLPVVPPRGNPVRGHLPVGAVGRAAARTAETRRGSGRRGFRPRALSLDLPPCTETALGQPEGRPDARDVRTQPRLVHGDPARPQGPNEHVLRS